jgi:CheY-like chemotaxis protein
MLVDDDRTITTLLKTLLELDGFSVVVVARGDQAVTRAQAEKPDAIVMDVHIGETDGIEVLRALRQTPDVQSIPVIMSSGMDVEDQCLAAGATAFVLKPYPPEQLSAALQKVTA